MAQITEEERAIIIQTFEAFGKITRSNCRRVDGHITSGDLKTVLKKLGQNPTDEELAELIRVCDVQKNRKIEFNEFCRYMGELHRKIFNEIDANGNGYITPEEVVVGFKKMGAILSLDEAKAIVSGADTNKDGRISYTEFVKAVQARPLM